MPKHTYTKGGVAQWRDLPIGSYFRPFPKVRKYIKIVLQKIGNNQSDHVIVADPENVIGPGETFYMSGSRNTQVLVRDDGLCSCHTCGQEYQPSKRKE